MNYKSLRRLILLSIGLGILGIILFSVFIAPNRTLPILMYHSITKVEEKDDVLSLSKDIFKSQMEYLSKHNYHVVSLKEVAGMMREGRDIPNNWVVLTFDDGNKDFYDKVYPILKKYQFNATVFVIVDSLAKSQNSLNWDQVKQLAKDDLIDIGSHSLSHRLLPLLALQRSKKEILLSKSIIEEKLKEPVVSFAYPYGAVNDSIKEMVKEAGFEVGVGTAYQRGQFKDHDIYTLRRVFVSKFSKYPFIFRFMLSGYYVATREFVLRVLNIKTPHALYITESSGSICRPERWKGFAINLLKGELKYV